MQLAYFRDDYQSLRLGKSFKIHYLVEMVLQLPLCNANACTWMDFHKDDRDAAITTLETIKELMVLNKDGASFGSRLSIQRHEMAHKMYFQKLYLIAWYIASKSEAEQRPGAFLIKDSSPDVSRAEGIRQDAYWRAYDHIVEQKMDDLAEGFARLSDGKEPLFDYTSYDNDVIPEVTFHNLCFPQSLDQRWINIWTVL